MAKKKQESESGMSTKEKARDIVRKEIEKSYGKGALITMGDDYIVDVPYIGTGVISIDLALGVPIPRGRIIEIYGPESSGKTTLTLHIAAECQKKGGNVAFVDAEHALDVAYAKNLGVDVGDMDLSQPDNGEQALEITDMLVKSGAYDLVIVDSVAALTPRAELEGDMGDSHMGLQARLMSQGLRKLTGSMARSNTTVVFINQLRMKIGVMFGNPETTTGGRALAFYSSQRIDIRRIGAIKDGDEVIGNQTRIKVVKNKVAPPFRITELDIMYGQGFDKLRDLIGQAVNAKIIDKNGAWFSYGDMKLGQGIVNTVNTLKEDEKLLKQIEEQTLHFIKTGELPC